MECLPIIEANDVPYQSQKPPESCNACGHDAHTSVIKLGPQKIFEWIKGPILKVQSHS